MPGKTIKNILEELREGEQNRTYYPLQDDQTFKITIDPPVDGIYGNYDYVKPPIGIEPRYVSDWRRHIALKDAILRYIDNGLEILQEWISEYNEYVNKESISDPNRRDLPQYEKPSRGKFLSIRELIKRRTVQDKPISTDDISLYNIYVKDERIKRDEYLKSIVTNISNLDSCGEEEDKTINIIQPSDGTKYVWDRDEYTYLVDITGV